MPCPSAPQFQHVRTLRGHGGRSCVGLGTVPLGPTPCARWIDKLVRDLQAPHYQWLLVVGGTTTTIEIVGFGIAVVGCRLEVPQVSPLALALPLDT